jgi:hypothetical protein
VRSNRQPDLLVAAARQGHAGTGRAGVPRLAATPPAPARPTLPRPENNPVTLATRLFGEEPDWPVTSGTLPGDPCSWPCECHRLGPSQDIDRDGAGQVLDWGLFSVKGAR